MRGVQKVLLSGVKLEAVSLKIVSPSVKWGELNPLSLPGTSLKFDLGEGNTLVLDSALQENAQTVKITRAYSDGKISGSMELSTKSGTTQDRAQEILSQIQKNLPDSAMDGQGFNFETSRDEVAGAFQFDDQTVAIVLKNYTSEGEARFQRNAGTYSDFIAWIKSVSVSDFMKSAKPGFLDRALAQNYWFSENAVPKVTILFLKGDQKIEKVVTFDRTFSGIGKNDSGLFFRFGDDQDGTIVTKPTF